MTHAEDFPDKANAYLVERVSEVKAADMAAVHQNASNVIAELGAKSATDEFNYRVQPLMKEVWLGMIAHASSKPFSQYKTSIEYDPDYYYGASTNIWDEENEKSAVKQRIQFRDSERQSFIVPGLSWVFESQEVLEGEPVKTCTELFIPQSAADYKKPQSELSVALKAIADITDDRNTGNSPLQSTKHKILGVSSERVGIRKHAVALQRLLPVIQHQLINEADVLFFNTKVRLLASGMQKYWGNTWMPADEILYGQLWRTECLEGISVPRVNYASPVFNDTDTQYEIARGQVSAELEKIDVETPQLALAFLNRSF